MNVHTPLYETHCRMGAKMVDFSGWQMPIHYGSQIEEHHAVRQRAGMFDVSHMTVVDIHGDDARVFLRELLANDIDKLTVPGRALYSCMLNPQGCVLDDLIAYFMGENNYRLIVNAATREKDLAWLNQQAEGRQLTITPQTRGTMIAVQGPEARERVHAQLTADLREKVSQLPRFSACAHGDWFVARTGYTGEDGYELVLPASEGVELWEELVKAGVAPAGLGARDTLRIEAGMALYGNDLDEQHTPLVSGLSWTVSMADAERGFIGRAALQAQRDTGLQQKMVGLQLDGRGVLRGGQKIIFAGGQAGEITSGTYSPTLQASIALARVNADVEKQCEADIRGKHLPARIVDYPFINNSRA